MENKSFFFFYYYLNSLTGLLVSPYIKKCNESYSFPVMLYILHLCFQTMVTGYFVLVFSAKPIV